MESKLKHFIEQPVCIINTWLKHFIGSRFNMFKNPCITWTWMNINGIKIESKWIKIESIESKLKNITGKEDCFQRWLPASSDGYLLRRLLPAMAVIEPLEKAVLVNKFNTPATSTRIPERIIGVSRIHRSHGEELTAASKEERENGYGRSEMADRRRGELPEFLSATWFWSRLGRGLARRRCCGCVVASVGGRRAGAGEFDWAAVVRSSGAGGLRGGLREDLRWDREWRWRLAEERKVGRAACEGDDRRGGGFRDGAAVEVEGFALGAAMEDTDGATAALDRGRRTEVFAVAVDGGIRLSMEF